MFQDLKPYPAYGDSRSWEGQVPSHWRLASMRALAREVAVSGVPDEPMLSVSIKHGVTPQSVVLAMSGKRDSSNVDRSSYKLVEPGDVAYNKMRAWQGAAGLSAYRGIVSPAYIVLRPDLSNCDPVYLHHLLRLPAYAAEAARWSYGISSDQWSLRPEDFRLIPAALPPVEEQKAIVTYLAHAHQRIDKAIAAKRRLGALLNEQRRHVVDRLVSTGQSESTSYIGTGSMWLSKIPRGWRYIPVKRVIGEGPTNGVSPQVAESGDLKTLSLAAVRNGRVSGHPDVTKFVSRANVRSVDSYRLCEGDVLIVRGNGRLQLVGRPGLVCADVAREEFIYPDLLIRVRVNELMDERYFVHALSGRAARAQIETAARTAVGTFKVSGEDIKSVLVPLPPLAEQRAIVEKIDQETAVFDATVSATVREIELLEEFRTRLTADVVTGQVDVLSIGANLPPIDPADVFAAFAGAGDAGDDTADEVGMEVE